jgi:hypothetical protein
MSRSIARQGGVIAPRQADLLPREKFKYAHVELAKEILVSEVLTGSCEALLSQGLGDRWAVAGNAFLIQINICKIGNAIGPYPS